MQYRTSISHRPDIIAIAARYYIHIVQLMPTRIGQFGAPAYPAGSIGGPSSGLSGSIVTEIGGICREEDLGHQARRRREQRIQPPPNAIVLTLFMDAPLCQVSSTMVPRRASAYASPVKDAATGLPMSRWWAVSRSASYTQVAVARVCPQA